MHLRDEGIYKVSTLYLSACTCNSMLYKRLQFLWGHARRNPYYSYLIKTFTERKEESGGRGGGSTWRSSIGKNIWLSMHPRNFTSAFLTLMDVKYLTSLKVQGTNKLCLNLILDIHVMIN